MIETDYRIFYNLEDYLFATVRTRFASQGYLSAFDFFCIVIWKANRAKSKIARRLLLRDYPDLDTAVRTLTANIAGQPMAEDRLRHMLQEWGFLLPMASAILTVLYPDEFTIYDIRVCNILGKFHSLGTMRNFDQQWKEYLDYRRAVEENAPTELSLRDKDRYLWGRSFCEQLRDDISRAFIKA